MKYPEIIASETLTHGTSLVLQLFIARQIDYFSGHFPKTPVLAGVVQVDWAISYAQQYLNINKANFKGIKQLKFSQVILPDTYVSLKLSIEQDLLYFQYFNQQTVYASGKININ